MNRKFKSIGAALIISLGIGALAAQTATATELTAASYPVSIYGELPSGAEHQMAVAGGEIECDEVDFTGTMSATTTTQAVSAVYGGCDGFGLSASVSMGGCGYVLHTQASGLAGTIDLTCPSGKEMVAVLAGGVCEVKVKAQSGLAGLTYSNSGSLIKINFFMTGIHAVVNGIWLCPMSNGTYNNATYKGDLLVGANGGSVKLDVG